MRIKKFWLKLLSLDVIDHSTVYILLHKICSIYLIDFQTCIQYICPNNFRLLRIEKNRFLENKLLKLIRCFDFPNLFSFKCFFYSSRCLFLLSRLAIGCTIKTITWMNKVLGSRNTLLQMIVIWTDIQDDY